ncbi:hypothetical protein [Azospirillum brasilense]|uniref:hypothetical protein n=1 Tax=Azospirillum brasilense TaxID=192 RepID=UPI0020005A6C|nr:hypothetical protein [Azospirillum brasilense]
MVTTLCDAAVAVLTTAAPLEKVRLTRDYAAAWRDGRITEFGALAPPERRTP